MSLIEALIVVLIVAVLLTMASVSLKPFRDAQAVRGAVEDLRGHLNWAKYKAVISGRNVYVAFRRGGSWCYTVSTDPGCHCDVDCSANPGLLLTASYENLSEVTMERAAFAGSHCGAVECVRFDGRKGLSLGTNGSVTLSQGDVSAKVIVSALGRIRNCRVSGEWLGEFPRCN